MAYDFAKLQARLMNYLRRFESHMRANPRLRALSVVVAGLLIVFVSRWIAFGSMVLQQPFLFFPLPPLLYLFLKAGDAKSENLYRELSFRSLNIAASGFFLAIFVTGFAHTAALATGIIGGMFSYMSYHEFRRLVSRSLYAAVVALIGSLSGIFYFYAQKGLWKVLAEFTAKTVHSLLHPLITSLSVVIKSPPPPAPHLPPPHMHQFHRMVPRRVFGHFTPRPAPNAGAHPPFHPPVPQHPKPNLDGGIQNFVALLSDSFAMKICMIENLTVGIFLFLFLLSLELVLSGRKVKPLRLVALALGGIVSIFLLNVLFIAVYFLVNHFAQAPDAAGIIVYLGRVIAFMHSSNLVTLLSYIVVSVLLIKWFFKNPALLSYTIDLPKARFRS